MALLVDRHPLIQKGWQRAAAFCIAYISSILLISLIWALLGKMPAAETVLNGSALFQLVLFLSAILEIVLVLLFTRFVDRRPVMDIGFDWPSAKQDAWIGFLLGPALLGAGSLILYAHQNLQWTGITFDAAGFFLSVVLIGVIAVSEEMVIRGYLLRNLLQSMNKWAALGISAALFALAHIGNPGIHSIAILNIFLGGVLLGINYVYTRNLWFAICFHFSWNFFQGPVLGYEVSGLPLQGILQQQLSGPGWLTGYQFGFEGSAIATLVMLIAIVLLYIAYEARPALRNKRGRL
jgi:uncharacterized protein